MIPTLVINQSRNRDTTTETLLNGISMKVAEMGGRQLNESACFLKDPFQLNDI